MACKMSRTYFSTINQYQRFRIHVIYTLYNRYYYFRKKRYNKQTDFNLRTSNVKTNEYVQLVTINYKLASGLTGCEKVLKIRLRNRRLSEVERELERKLK